MYSLPLTNPTTMAPVAISPDAQAPQIFQIQELTEKQKDMITASVPVLEQLGQVLTQKFYQKMLSEYDDVKPFFNDTNQKSLRQPKVLAFALLNYARNINDITPLTAFVKQIVVKHCGLQVRAEHYPIVGTCLLTTLKELLGEETATPEFLKAWETAYGNLAQILINMEFDVYKSLDWQEFREFRVTRLDNESDNVKSVYFTPSDGGRIAIPQRGQYVCIRWKLPGAEFEKSREYSLSQFPTANEYRISVKKLEDGAISTYVHEHLKIGDTVRVAPPSGQFTYKQSDNDVLLFVGGIGITPIVPIAEKALEDGKKVTLFDSNHTIGARPFADTFNLFKKYYGDKFEVKEFISNHEKDIRDEKKCNFSTVKFASLTPEDFDTIDFSKSYDIYLLGPVGYMKFVRDELSKRKVDGTQIYSEFFGPTAVE